MVQPRLVMVKKKKKTALHVHDMHLQQLPAACRTSSWQAAGSCCKYMSCTCRASRDVLPLLHI
jgi:hypothetical protein